MCAHSHARVLVIGIPQDLEAILSPYVNEASGPVLILGSDRQLATLPSAIVEHELVSTLNPWGAAPIEDFVRSRVVETGERIVVLASGDPNFFGVGLRLLEGLNPAGTSADERISVECIPAHSSLTFAAQRVGVAPNALLPVSLLDAGASVMNLYVDSARPLLVLVPNSTVAQAMATVLPEHYELHVLSNLGFESESHQVYSAGEATALVLDGPTVIVVLPQAPLCARPAVGLPDSDFATDGQMTKRDMRVLAVADASLGRDFLRVWDLGAGSGTVGLEILRSFALRSLGHASRSRAIDQVGGVLHSVEPVEARQKFIALNATNLGLDSAVHIHGEKISAELLDSLYADGAPDVIFYGGGVQKAFLDRAMELLAPGGVLIAHGVTLETQALLSSYAGTEGIEISGVQFSSWYQLGSMSALKPQFPQLRLVYRKALS
ncbi:MAG: SAM-dependent methyltransferase [Corynebacterium sp.]|nr:SAM-dependent methyltransferase [Corynebacterium sp.]